MGKIHLSTALVSASLLLSLSSYAEEIDMSGFDDAPIVTTQEETVIPEVPIKKSFSLGGVTGKLTEQIAYSPNTTAPHDGISSVKSSILLDYEHKFENKFKIKINAKAYYDAIYEMQGTSKFSTQERDELESEAELFDAYLEGSISDSFDFKVGRQVVVWGRSDTIRVTDVLNPIDNRRPGMVDIEDLRLPVAMAKFDYFIGDWRVTPIAILEQRFSKNPPFGSVYNPSPIASPSENDYTDLTYALSIGGEFSGWDVNFYGANIYDDVGQIALPTKTIKHEKINMVGTALNVLSGSWLFKTELAYFDGLKYTSTGDKSFSRIDALVGVEYKGIADTLLSYDVVIRQMGNYDTALLGEYNPIEEKRYQHAFRASSDFFHASLTANYLISLYGKQLDKGGFQRAWVKYELGQGIITNVGFVDYIGGSKLFDAIKDNDMIFADISYSF